MVTRFWKAAGALGVLLACAVGLIACSGVAWKVRTECRPRPPGPGGAYECSVSGEVSGTFGGFRAPALMAAASLSASQYTFDYDGSTVGFPSTGMATVRLFDASGATLASKAFAWARTGTVMYFANPSAVDSWAAPYADQAASSEVSIDSAPVSTVPGSNRVQVVARDNGVDRASSMTSFMCLHNCGRHPGPIDPYGQEHGLRD